MPFGSRETPSLGLSLLEAALARVGIASTIDYFSLQFADRIGPELYDAICQSGTTNLAGEWLFAADLSSALESRAEEYAARYLARETRIVDALPRLRPQIGAFLELAADDVIRRKPRVVGFSSTFQQHVPSLALARALKKRDPNVIVVFGGANCEGVMGAETVRRFSFVDAVVSGEGDLVIVDVVRALLSGSPIDGIPGVYTAYNLDRVARDGYPSATTVRDMDALPFPEYSDFFTQRSALPALQDKPPCLLIEFSRGCWWGEKHHCTFCGLNGSTMQFRNKTAARALEEIRTLLESYPTRIVELVDNILDMRYFSDLLPSLATSGLDLDLFVEVKANLKKEQIRLLRDVGARVIQPGVESLSTSVLQLMDKGVGRLQNLQLLKWCKELGVDPKWNFLWGFPRERPDEYAAMAAQVPFITHLPPPLFDGKIQLNRFSPNFIDPERYGLRNVRPAGSYRYIYDLPNDAVANLAYYFDFDVPEGQEVDAYVGPLRQAIDSWRAAHVDSELLSISFNDYLLIVDARTATGKPAHVLSGVERALYEACDSIAALRRLHEVSRAHGCEMTDSQIEALMRPFIDDGLIVREGNTFLNLAIPFGEYVPKGALRERLIALRDLAA